LFDYFDEYFIHAGNQFVEKYNFDMFHQVSEQSPGGAAVQKLDFQTVGPACFIVRQNRVFFAECLFDFGKIPFVSDVKDV
jgi:hypothetical protein